MVQNSSETNRGSLFHGGEEDRWFTPGRFAALLAVLIGVAFADVLFGSNTFFIRDFGYFGYPLAHYHRVRFWSGEIPLWNPLNNGGLPFLAQWNTLVLYPGSLIYLLLPLPWSLNVFCLFHQFLAGLGMYLLSRRWVKNRFASAAAGILFAFNGLTLNCLMWPNNIAALGWMPFVVLLAERACREGGRMAAAAASIGAMQMLTGAPEIILLTWAIVLVVWLNQPARLKALLRLGLAASLSVCFSAGQLLPFIDLVAHSQRDKAFGDSAWSMPGWGWANLLVPLFRCFLGFHGVYAQQGQYWTSSYYTGAAALVVALVAVLCLRGRIVWLLATLTGLGLVLALGDDGYLYGWLRAIIPQFGFMRYPIKFIVLALFSIPLLAAFGLDHVQRSSAAGLPRSWKVAIVVSLVFLAFMSGIIGFSYLYPGVNEKWSVTLQCGLGRAAFLLLILATLYTLTRLDLRRTKVLAQLTFLLLLALDALTHMPRQNPTVAKTIFAPALGLAHLSPPPRHGELRVMVSRAALIKLKHFAASDPFKDYICNRQASFINCNLLDGIPKLDGFYSLYLRPADNVRSLLYGSTNDLPALWDFLNVAYMTAPENFLEWTSRPTFMPLATVGQKPLFSGDATSFAALGSTNFNPRQTVYLPAEAKQFVSTTNQTQAKVLFSRFKAQWAEIDVSAEQPSLLVIAQAFDYPWRAEVDGRRVPLWRANYAYQALPIPAGRHRVELAYRDVKFCWGVLLSAATLAGCLAAWFRPRP